MPPAPAGQGRLGQGHVHHVGGQQRVGGGAAEVQGDDLGEALHDAFGEQKTQGQFLFQPRQAHQHLEGLALETNLQRLLHHHQIVGIFHPALADSAGWGMFGWLSHRIISSKFEVKVCLVTNG